MNTSTNSDTHIISYTRQLTRRVTLFLGFIILFKSVRVIQKKKKKARLDNNKSVDLYECLPAADNLFFCVTLSV